MKKLSYSRALLIIDPQNDICSPEGSLYSKGAEEIIENIANEIESMFYDKIVITQETRQPFNINHQCFWEDAPEIGTVITIPEDISRNLYRPNSIGEDNIKKRIMSVYAFSGDKVKITPEGLLEGTWGWCFPKRLTEALNNWSRSRFSQFNVIRKGSNPYKPIHTILDEGEGFEGFGNVGNLYICGFFKEDAVYKITKEITTNDLLRPAYVSKLLTKCTLSASENSEEFNVKFIELNVEPIDSRNGGGLGMASSYKLLSDDGPRPVMGMRFEVGEPAVADERPVAEDRGLVAGDMMDFEDEAPEGEAPEGPMEDVVEANGQEEEANHEPEAFEPLDQERIGNEQEVVAEGPQMPRFNWDELVEGAIAREQVRQEPRRRRN